MVRFFVAFTAVVILGCVVAAQRAVWATPGARVSHVPKNVRNNPGNYRPHYRSVYVYSGGK